MAGALEYVSRNRPAAPIVSGAVSMSVRVMGLGELPVAASGQPVKVLLVIPLHHTVAWWRGFRTIR